MIQICINVYVVFFNASKTKKLELTLRSESILRSINSKKEWNKLSLCLYEKTHALNMHLSTGCGNDGFT